MKNVKILGLIALLSIAIAVGATINPALARGSRAPEAIGTTLAFDDGKVVTIQYSQNYFCNSPGPATSPTSSPCIIGVEQFQSMQRLQFGAVFQ